MSTISASTTTTTAYVVTADTTGALVLQTGATPTTAVTVDTSQNVGIGSTPVNSRRLTVNTSGQTDLSIVAGSTSYGQLLFGYTGADNKGILAYNNSDNSMQFYANSVERMRIDSSGNVGIGATSTGAKLYVSGYANSTTSWNVTKDGSDTIGSGPTFQLQNAAGTRSWVTQLGGSNSYDYWYFDGSSWTQKMRIDSSGNLLVGRTSGVSGIAPSGALNVYSSSTSGAYSFADFSTSGASVFRIKNDGYLIAATTYSNTSGSGANMYIDGGGYIYRSTSSLKYKTNIQDATYGLKEVLNLRPVTYQSNQKDGDGNILSQVFGGLIAEEVDAIGLTEFVQYAEDGSPDALAYGNMVSLCVKAIQELKAELDTVKAELKTKVGA